MFSYIFRVLFALSLLVISTGAQAANNDFNNDGFSDILWRNTNSGQNTIWRSANSATTQPVSNVASLAWTVAGIGDFNGDGISDILWRNTSSGQNTIWGSGNSATTQPVSNFVGLSWNVQ